MSVRGRVEYSGMKYMDVLGHSTPVSINSSSENQRPTVQICLGTWKMRLAWHDSSDGRKHRTVAYEWCVSAYVIRTQHTSHRRDISVPHVSEIHHALCAPR